MKKYSNIVKKTLIGSVIFACVCLSIQAQTAEQLEKYKAAIKSQENFNKIQREAGMPEMPTLSFEEWEKQEAEKAQTAQVSPVQKKLSAEERWEMRMEKIRPQLCTLVPVGKESQSPRAVKAKKEKTRLLEVAAEAYKKQPEIEQKLDAIAVKHGVKRNEKNIEGKPRMLAGELDGVPVWIESHNQVAAAGISADELWPTNSAPWPSSSTGRNLTGTNVVLGMWEYGGGVNTNHLEFSGRVLQCDSPTNLNDHATGVAGTMAAHGNTIDLQGIPSGDVARGVAFNAYVDAYDLKLFNSEIVNALAGTPSNPGLRISNHSWGSALNTWFFFPFNGYFYNSSTGNYEYYNGSYAYPGWNWDGLDEETMCGRYTPDYTGGYGCTQIDAIMSTNATRHLFVYSSGNSRFNSLHNSWPLYFYWSPSRNEWVVAHRGTSADIKDWYLGDGDTYGFDTVMAPGSAKNVLTVGSVKDVYYIENSQAYLGYTNNSIINVSSFSSCGPTDDGRIKPDVVAVGEADSSIRSYGIVTPASTGTDDYTTDYRGTSFSAPSVTGGIGLCQERRTQLFPNLDPETDDLLNSSLKALAIHTADDVLNTGPDYLTGWGLFNAVSAVQHVELDALDGRGTHIKELELAVGETNSWTIYLDGFSFKATIAWSDLAGNPSTNITEELDVPTPMLVNNLDLWIESDDGTQIFQPWILDPDLQQERESVRNAPATTGYDDRNNVEQVAITAPTPGYYKICITHAGGIAGGQTPNTQKVSILTSGDTPLDPNIAEFEQTPTNGIFVLSVACDPGAYLMVESTTNLVSGAWQTNGTFTTIGNTNSILVNSSTKTRFWRIRRETGVE